MGVKYESREVFQGSRNIEKFIISREVNNKKIVEVNLENNKQINFTFSVETENKENGEEVVYWVGVLISDLDDILRCGSIDITFLQEAETTNILANENIYLTVKDKSKEERRVNLKYLSMNLLSKGKVRGSCYNLEGITFINFAIDGCFMDEDEVRDMLKYLFDTEMVKINAS